MAAEARFLPHLDAQLTVNGRLVVAVVDVLRGEDQLFIFHRGSRLVDKLGLSPAVPVVVSRPNAALRRWDPVGPRTRRQWCAILRTQGTSALGQS